MTVRLPQVLCVLAASVLAGCATIQDRLGSARTMAEIARATADFYVADGGDDTCAVALVRGDETVFATAGGTGPHSLYRVASLSKIFLYPVLLNLHETGRLDLDRPITAYSRMDLPPECARVTLRDLLRNRSGLPREFMRGTNPQDMHTALICGFAGTHIYAGFDTRETFARELWRPVWRAALKEGGNIYSNMGFGLAGTVVEDALGKDLDTILKEELTEPCGYADTFYAPPPEARERMTRACAGHLPWLVRRHHEVPDHRLGDALRAAGGLFSSVADCARFFPACWPILDAAFREHPLADYGNEDVYGLLRVRVLKDGRKILYRAGMIYGGASFLGFDPSTRTVVVILRNVTSWPDRRGFAVMEALNRITR